MQTPPIKASQNEPRSPVSLWQMAILAGLLLWLYIPILVHLVEQWWHDPNYGYGFIVPVFSAYLLWLERDRLARVSQKPSWSGIVLLAFALCALAVGQLGAELFSARFSLLLVLAALTVLFLGWSFFRATLFPWAFLFLMIPLPTLVLSRITFPLQLLASQVSADTLEVLGVPVGLQGNVLNLAAMPLNVAEACSGIRSLTALLTLAIIFGYLMEKRRWVRWLLAVASLPIAIAANCVRIIGTGLLVQYGSPDKAEGYYHTAWGLIIYIIALLMLFGLHALVVLLWPAKENGSAHLSPLTERGKRAVPSTAARFALAAILIAATGTVLQARGRYDVFPPRLPLASFPLQLGPWTGQDIPIPQDALDVLGHGEFLQRWYQPPESSDLPSPELFIVYYPSQRSGDTPHSPQHCLPGSGLVPVSNDVILLSYPGHAPFPANRYVVARENVRKLVLYWFWAHDRGVASEYRNKYYLIHDSIRLRRSDGAMVRIIITMEPDETPEAAQRRILPFALEVMPLMNTYIPR